VFVLDDDLLNSSMKIEITSFIFIFMIFGIIVVDDDAFPQENVVREDMTIVMMRRSLFLYLSLSYADVDLNFSCSCHCCCC